MYKSGSTCLLFSGSGRESENDSGEDKLSHHSSSPESGICNSCDRQSLISGQIASGIDVEALAWGNTTHMGGRLSVADSGTLISQTALILHHYYYYFSGNIIAFYVDHYYLFCIHAMQ